MKSDKNKTYLCKIMNITNLGICLKLSNLRNKERENKTVFPQ